MRNIVKLFFTLVFVLNTNAVRSASPTYDFIVDGIYYHIISEEARTVGVTAGPDANTTYYKGDISIPESVTYNQKTYEVTTMLVEAMYRSSVNTLRIPKTVTKVEGLGMRASTIVFEETTTPIHLKNNSTLRSEKELIINRPIVYDDKETTWSSSYSNSSLEKITFGKNVKSLADSEFSKCQKLKTVIIEGNSIAIGKKTFYDCLNLKDIDFSKISRIGEYAFYECNSIENVDATILTEIGEYAFGQSKGIKTVTMPAVESIGDYAFVGCENLTSAWLPTCLKEIGEYPFGFTNITEFNYPDGCQFKGGYTFMEVAKSLTDIYIGNGFENIPGGRIGGGYKENVPLYKNLYLFSPKMDYDAGSVNPKYVYCAYPDNYANIFPNAIRSKLVDIEDTEYEYTGKTPEFIYRSNIPGFDITFENNPIHASAGRHVGSVKTTFTKNYWTTSCDIPYSYTIKKAPLTVYVSSCVKKYGEKNPEFKIEYIGFKNGENEDVLTTKPTVLTSVVGNTTPGTYPIYIAGASAQNYEITYLQGVFTVEKLTQNINWSQNFNTTYVDDKIELKATSSSGNQVQYSVSDNNIATVIYESGKYYLLCMQPGTVKLYANEDGNEYYDPAKQTEKAVIVKSKVATAINLNTQKIAINKGGSYQLKATLTPADVDNNKIIWSSSDEKVVTVDKNGKVTAVNVGEAVVTGTPDSNHSIKAECKVVVNQPVTELTIDCSTITIYQIGGTAQLTANIVPIDAVNKKVIWKSMTPSICSITENGVVTAIGSGTAIVTATSDDGGFTAYCIVTVKNTGAEIIDGYTFENQAETECKKISYSRSYSNTQWQSLYIPFSIKYEDWKNDFELARINDVHQFDYDEDGEIDLTELEAIKIKTGYTEPNTPYLIKAKNTGNKTTTSTNEILYKTEENTFDVTSWNTKFCFTGTYKTITGTDMMANGYYAMGGGTLKQAASASSDLQPFRWYMSVTDRNGNPKAVNEVKIMVFDDEWDADNVELTTNDKQEAEMYDLSGRKVKNATKGIYIKNGKKVLVK